ncbi:MAG: hypothetical protein AB2556_23475 [Candidatus Thiodiazotropha sp.]
MLLLHSNGSCSKLFARVRFALLRSNGAGSGYRGSGSGLSKGDRYVFVELGLFPLLFKNNGKRLSRLLCVGWGFRNFGSRFRGFGSG